MAISVDYLVVAGGGAGGDNGGGGGGAGGLLSGTTSLTSGTNYAITVGAGGATTGQPAASGQPTSLGLAAYSNLFNGTNYLNLPASSNLAISTGDFTIESWVYLTSAGNVYPFIYSQARTGTSLDIRFGNNGFGNYLQVAVDSATVSSVWSCNLTQTAALNSWNHIAFTRSGTTCRLFVNGIQQSLGSGANPATFPSTSFTDSTNIPLPSAAPSIGFGFTGYISNFRVVKGTAVYTANFIPPTAPLTAITNTVLLTCNSSTITDNSTSALTITNTNTVTVSTQNPTTTFSNYFDGTGDYLSVASNTQFAFGTGDFTIEVWLYATSLSTGNRLICFNLSGSSPIIYIGSAGQVNLATFGSGNNNVNYLSTAGGTIKINTWYHLAVSRVSGTSKIFVDGIQVGSVSDSNNWGQSGVRIGADDQFTFTGYLSNLRIVKGTGLYTANFTTSTTPRTAITNTVLLTCNAATLIDRSTNNFTITKNGDVYSSSFGPTFGFVTVGGGGGAGRDSGGGGVLGGSGGGGADGINSTQATAGAGTSGQGFAGGAGTTSAGAGGGGGAGGTGNASPGGGTNGAGGVGKEWPTASGTYYAGGGGGARCPGLGSTGSIGGAGGGGTGNGTALTKNGTANTGGGGGGNGGLGGSGVVVVRYLTSSVANASGGTPTTSGSYTLRTFASSGTLSLIEYFAGMPINTVAPQISGTVGIGTTLTCTQGTWTGNDTITYSYQWNRDGIAISGATASTYTTVSQDAWKAITCTVTATNGAGINFAVSNSILLNITATVATDIAQGTASQITYTAIKGDAITVAETKQFSLNTPIALQVGDTFTNLLKQNYSLIIGDAITVAEAKHFSLNINTVRQIGDNFTNLTQLYGWPDRTDNITFNTYTGGGSLTSYEAWYLS